MSWWNNTYSVRGPLITAISLILLMGFLITNAISYQVSKDSLRQALMDNELPLTSDNIYSEIQQDLLKPVLVASLMANDTFVKDWLLNGEKNIWKITRYLDEIRRKYGVFTSFLVSDATHNYYHFSGLSQVVSKDDPRDVWYFRVRGMTESHEINLDMNPEQNDVLTIYINHKILDYNGDYLAATGVGLEFSTVSKVVERYKKHFGRHVYFIDETGNVAVRSDGATITEDNIRSAPGISKIADAIMASDHGFFEYQRDGETMLVTTRHIPELGWRVLVEQLESEALGAIRQSLITNSLIGLGVIALTILIITYTVSQFHSRLEIMATTDRLTGIGNRQKFELELAQALTRRRRDNMPYSIILFDVDHFKRINDTLGHLAGDTALQRIAEVMQENVRETDFLCRWGGEELIVLAYNCKLDDAVAMAEKIRKTIEKAALAVLPDESSLTVSAGIAEARDEDDTDALIDRADKALYQAKREGRNRICRA